MTHLSSEQSETVLRMWIIYDHPRDFPTWFVLRGWDVDAAGARPTSDFFLASSLEGIHKLLPDGMFPLGRQPGDDPVIIEVWV